MSTPDLTSELAQLDRLTNFELRAEWRRLHRRQPPPSFSQELLLLGLAYKIQEEALGGLSKSALRKLSRKARLTDEPRNHTDRAQAWNAPVSGMERPDAYGSCARQRR